MYLRFIAPAAPGCGPVTRVGVAPGLFGPAGDLWWDSEHLTPTLIAIRAELDWFNANLPIPNRLGVKARGVWWRDGVCWFRDSAREMLRHAHTLAALIEDCGVVIERIRTRDPGQILYRDDWQVVAKPQRLRPARSNPPPASPLTALRHRLAGGFSRLKEAIMPKYRDHSDQPCFRADQQAP